MCAQSDKILRLFFALTKITIQNSTAPPNRYLYLFHREPARTTVQL